MFHSVEDMRWHAPPECPARKPEDGGVCARENRIRVAKCDASTLEVPLQLPHAAYVLPSSLIKGLIEPDVCDVCPVAKENEGSPMALWVVQLLPFTAWFQ